MGHCRNADFPCDHLCYFCHYFATYRQCFFAFYFGHEFYGLGQYLYVHYYFMWFPIIVPARYVEKKIDLLCSLWQDGTYKLFPAICDRYIFLFWMGFGLSGPNSIVLFVFTRAPGDHHSKSAQ